jgi:hypothetical protein
LQKIFSLVKKLFFFFCLVCCVPILICAQTNDSIPAQKDSLQNAVVPVIVDRYNSAVQSILSQNIFLNSSGKPVSMAAKAKRLNTTDPIFYLLAGLVLIMALIKLFFARYFTNIFRVFFNTSLRQSQLTDQLLQAKLPSLFFNIFFIISGGIYIYFLLLQYRLINDGHRWTLMAFCIFILGLVYLVKFCSLKFTGWVTGYRETTDTYIFIIFLICKIIGILVIPFTVLIAFSGYSISITSALVSILIIVFLLLLRFFRSYGLLQNQLKVSRFHFFLYITGVEIIPLLLIYKSLLILLTKNL